MISRRSLISFLSALGCTAFFACTLAEAQPATEPPVLQTLQNDTKKTIKAAKEMLEQHVPYPFYFGGSLGYGNTDWSEITTLPQTINTPNPTALSAPTSASSGGFAYGVFAGYQFSEHFTLEGNITHYPTTKVGFQWDQILNPNTYGITNLNTNTYSYSLLGKILVPFGFTHLYVYADAGVTYVYRDDLSVTPNPDGDPVNFSLVHQGHFGPSFGFGTAYNFTPRIFTEASFQYTTGYGRADITPAEDYIPFVYSVMLNIGFRI